MGGAFTDKVSWRWCFYINLPIGATTIAVITLFFQTLSSTGGTSHGLRKGIYKLDLWGTLVFIPAVVSLLLALQWGGSKYNWKNVRIIALLCFFVVLISAFVTIQAWKKDDATVPPRLLRKRSIVAAAWYAFSAGAAFLIVVFYVSIRGPSIFCGLTSISFPSGSK